MAKTPAEYSRIRRKRAKQKGLCATCGKRRPKLVTCRKCYGTDRNCGTCDGKGKVRGNYCAECNAAAAERVKRSRQ